MRDNNDSGLIWGLIIGAIIALALLSRNNQQTLSPSANVQQSQQPQQSQQSQQLTWKPMDIPRVDDIKTHIVQPSVIQPPVISVQQDPKLIEMVSQLQKTSSQLEQTTSRLQELQDTVLKLQQNNQQPHTTIQPDTISQLEQTTSKLQETVSKLEQNSNIHSQTTSKLQETVSKLEKDNDMYIQTIQKPMSLSIEQIPAQPIEQIPVQQIYKNSEKWAIKRGSNGRIKSLEIARDVEKKS